MERYFVISLVWFGMAMVGCAAPGTKNAHQLGRSLEVKPDSNDLPRVVANAGHAKSRYFSKYPMRGRITAEEVRRFRASLSHSRQNVREPDSRSIRATSSSRQGSPNGTAGTQPLAPEGDQSRTLYKVKEGDTLSSIAREFYGGNGEDWARIFAANHDRIENPQKIAPNTLLVIPLDYVSN